MQNEGPFHLCILAELSGWEQPSGDFSLTGSRAQLRVSPGSMVLVPVPAGPQAAPSPPRVLDAHHTTKARTANTFSKFFLFLHHFELEIEENNFFLPARLAFNHSFSFLTLEVLLCRGLVLEQTPRARRPLEYQSLQHLEPSSH